MNRSEAHPGNAGNWSLHDAAASTTVRELQLRQQYYTATFQKRLSPRGPGHPAWVSRGGHRTGISSAPWSSLLVSLLWCRFWMHLWRRWWNSCRISRSSSTRSHLIPSRLAKCPKILPEDVPMRTIVRNTQLADQLVEVPTIITLSSLQRIVEDELLVFKVFFPDTIQQRCRFLRNAFLSRLWSRSLIFLVEAFKIFAQVRFHPLLRTFRPVFMKIWMKGVFSHFSQNEKKCEVGSVSAHPRLLLSSRTRSCRTPLRVQLNDGVTGKT